MKRMLNEEYKQAKEAFGIITSLGDKLAPVAEPPKKSKKRPRKAMAVVGGRSASAEAKAIAEALIQMTDAFCREFLNEEYAELCRKLATALARKRPSPLLRGRLETWASGVVRTIGWANFLHDPSQTPHLKLYSIDEAFGIAESTGAAKLKDDSDDVQDSSVRSQVDTPQQDGRQSDGLDAGGQRLLDGHSAALLGNFRKWPFRRD